MNSVPSPPKRPSPNLVSYIAPAVETGEAHLLGVSKVQVAVGS